MNSKHVKPTEDREERGQPTILRGEIILDGGVSTLDCLVRDISDRGCFLLMLSTVRLPSWFMLQIKQDGRRLPAKVKWRVDNTLGILFEETDHSSSNIAGFAA